MRNRTLSSFLARSRLLSEDAVEHVDSTLFPPALACAQVVSRMGCSMIFLGLLSMGDSIRRPAHRQKPKTLWRCHGKTIPVLRNAEEATNAFACLCTNSRGLPTGC
jgi:hypothetical protein